MKTCTEPPRNFLFISSFYVFISIVVVLMGGKSDKNYQNNHLLLINLKVLGNIENISALMWSQKHNRIFIQMSIFLKLPV